jgi:hypothetical protein
VIPDAGAFSSPEVLVRITRGDGYIDRDQAAELCGVGRNVITQWSTRGYLSRDGSERCKLPVALRENGHPLYDPVEVQKAEWATRERARRVVIRAA